MGKIKKAINYFTKSEIILWCCSVAFIILSFCIFDRSNYLTLAASLIGTTSLIFNAKGNPLGQVLIIIFSTIYGYISFSFGYYGEMLTYMCMSAPMAVISLISWLRNPYKGRIAEVTVNKIRRWEYPFMAALSLTVTVVFYFVLKAFGTANLIPSTVSVATSFAAVYLTFRRSPYFALAYAVNDIVLIVLWSLAAMQDISYVGVIVCFIIFLGNDIYSFVNWQRIQRRQAEEK